MGMGTRNHFIGWNRFGSSGNLIGLAALGGMISSSAAASTGIAISSLSDAAVSNAILAVWGGGTLRAGGAGVAGAQ